LSFLSLPFIKPCGQVGIASCPSLVKENNNNHSPQPKLS
jgi:hypothetical protein